MSYSYEAPAFRRGWFHGILGRNRTCDLRLRKPPLYLLSYEDIESVHTRGFEPLLSSS